MNKVLLFVAPVLTAGAEAFVEYLLNTNAPLTKEVLLHAALAAVAVDLTILKRMLLPAPAAPEAK